MSAPKDLKVGDSLAVVDYHVFYGAELVQLDARYTVTDFKNERDRDDPPPKAIIVQVVEVLD